MKRVLGVAVAALAAVRGNADEFDWRKTLEKPLSPGAVAVLVEHAAQPEAQERWKDGLRDGDADVRASTARALYAAGPAAAALLPQLKEALAAEKDVRVAQEQVRALVAVGSSDDDAAAIAAARRLPDLRIPTWQLLGRARGLASLAYLPTLREIDAGGFTRDCLVRAAISGGRAGVQEAAITALREDDEAAWYAVWDALRYKGVGIGEDLLVRSMTAPNPRIRAMTFWNLAMTRHHGWPAGQAVEDAARTAPEATLTAADVPKGWPSHEARFSYELLMRASGRKPKEDLAWAHGVPKEISPWPFPGFILPMAPLLTRGEQRILVKKEHLPSSPELDNLIRFHRWTPRVFDASEPVARLASFLPFPKGYVTGVTELTGCRQGSIDVAVTYDPAGRPLTVKPVSADLIEACAQAARIVAASHPFSLYARWYDVEGVALEPLPETITMHFFDPEVAAAAVKAEAEGGPYREVGGAVWAEECCASDIKVRKFAHEVIEPPKDPPARDGHAVMNVFVDAKGLVTDVQVVRSLGPVTSSFVRLARRTKYHPLLLNGQAVPFIISTAWTLPKVRHPAPSAP